MSEHAIYTVPGSTPEMSRSQSIDEDSDIKSPTELKKPQQEKEQQALPLSPKLQQHAADLSSRLEDSVVGKCAGITIQPRASAQQPQRPLVTVTTISPPKSPKSPKLIKEVCNLCACVYVYMILGHHLA